MDNKTRAHLTAADVLQRYIDEDLPAFIGVDLRDVNQAGNFGERPLDVAAVRGDIDEILALLEGGADINAPGELGNTPLHEAVSQQKLDVVKLLLSRGASLNISSEFGTPLEMAMRTGDEQIVSLLKAAANGVEE